MEIVNDTSINMTKICIKDLKRVVWKRRLQNVGHFAQHMTDRLRWVVCETATVVI